MTVPPLTQQTRNMAGAWTGALATVAFLLCRSAAWTRDVAFPMAPVLAIIAAALIVLIVRFEPNQKATVALSVCLGVIFTLFSFSLTLFLGR